MINSIYRIFIDNCVYSAEYVNIYLYINIVFLNSILVIFDITHIYQYSILMCIVYLLNYLRMVVFFNIIISYRLLWIMSNIHQ